MPNRSSPNNRRRINPFSRRHSTTLDPISIKLDQDSIHSLDINSFEFPYPPSRNSSSTTKKNKVNRRSIHSFPPQVRERESSLYSHRLDLSCFDQIEYHNHNHNHNHPSQYFYETNYNFEKSTAEATVPETLKFPNPEEFYTATSTSELLFNNSLSLSSPFYSSTPNLQLHSYRHTSSVPTLRPGPRVYSVIQQQQQENTNTIFETVDYNSESDTDSIFVNEEDLDLDSASTDGSFGCPCTPFSERSSSSRSPSSQSHPSRPISQSGDSGSTESEYQFRPRRIVFEEKDKKSKFTSPSVLNFFLPKKRLQIQQSPILESESKHKGDGALSKLKKIGIKSEIWSKSKTNNTMSTPIVPPRSALRTVPPPKTPPFVHERHSSLYLLPVDAPLEATISNTPSLSSGSGSDLDGNADTARRGEIRFSAQKLPKDTIKKGIIEKDPQRVRDGVAPKESSSGVYTPTTFPGAQGPRPSHFPSHVYTPSNFQLYGSNDQQTRSVSSTSTDSDLPQTPRTPFSPSNARALTSKTMAGLRRISGQITQFAPGSNALESRSISSPVVSASPTTMTYTFSSRDSYFPSSRTTTESVSASSRQSSWGPVTPTSSTFTQIHSKNGLGVGLAEKDGVTLYGYNTQGSPESPRSIGVPPSGYSNTTVSSPTSASTARGRRKPVPKIVGEDDYCVNEMGVRA